MKKYIKTYFRCYSRERLRKILRKKTSAEEFRFIYIFTSLHLHLCASTFSPISLISAHLHIYIHKCTSTSLLIFTSSHLYLASLPLSSTSHIFTSRSSKAGGRTAGAPRNATLCGDRACRANEMQARVRFVSVRRNPLRRSCVSSARNAGESAIWFCRGQPSAEIVRIECTKCRREYDLVLSRATLCGDRACREREMQARLRFVPVAGNPLRGSCMSSARNAGESGICVCPAQPSAEIVRVECAKRRRECDLYLSGATLCGDRACRVREMKARVRFDPVWDKPVRRSCVLSARNAGESTIGPGPGQPSAEIVRVEGAKRRRECDLRVSGATLCGTVDFVVQQL